MLAIAWLLLAAAPKPVRSSGAIKEWSRERVTSETRAAQP